ncbi:RNA polymerase sigma factor [Paenibacillus prosopidis]|uniref:RNA polymerase sigma factor n=1 Tax=Paenibacillus prosopidis TaxID=630520 RepID=A0A368VIT2_9BACL|nr:sigma-70 family RNA polymerase sigma factor [Paenibacillus prosopidis]RCW41201.1 RNA polymerase sigma factor (sigma-70 family) [Paenibacillus prosopidis]
MRTSPFVKLDLAKVRFSALLQAVEKIENFFGESAGEEGLVDVYYIGKEGSDIQDEDWIKAIQNGGPEQYRPFVQAYGPYIYRTVFAVLHSPHDAEDVTQEVLLQIYRSLPECRLDGLKTWITRIAVNRAIDFKRSRARRPEELSGGEVIPDSSQEQPAGMPAAETIAMEREDKRQIRVLVDRLPDNYREVVTAYYMEDKSYEQIAVETGLERKSVESRLYRARSWIKRHWRKEDFE